jgi:predicted transcriptional regulator
VLPKEKLLKLKNHLSNALNKKISHTDCAELIFISKSIIIPYLSNSKASFLRLSEIHGLDINDLAIDVIADVFRQDTDGNFVNIKNFTSKLYYSLEETNEENLFVHIKVI